MQSSAFMKYEIGTAPWDALSKQEYIKILKRMGKIVESAPQMGGTALLKIVVTYSQVHEIAYNLDEFRSSFSVSANYRYIQLAASCGALYLTCRFGVSPADRSIYLGSDTLAAPELEDIANGLRVYVEMLYSRYSVLIQDPFVPSETDSCSSKENQNHNEPYEAHPAKSQGNSSKQSRDWGKIGAIATILGLIATIIFGIASRIG